MPGRRPKQPPAEREVRRASTPGGRKVVVSRDGPYVISGDVPLAVQVIRSNVEGMSWDWEDAEKLEGGPEYALCRCGQSRNKPYCDGSHLRVRFHGPETANRAPYVEQAGREDGPTLALDDAESLCAFARFCDPGGKIWALIPRSDDPAARSLAMREAARCPGGRLVLHDKKSDHALEPKLPPSIGVVEDPALGVSGPLWIRGGIPIESADGTPYEVRNRVALCRCGASSNKPYCDGSHASIKFNDGRVPRGDTSPVAGRDDAA
jgi:CDGSH-type Zn-finger protein